MDFKLDWITLTLKPSDGKTTYERWYNVNDMCPLDSWCFYFLELDDIKDCFKRKQGSIQHYNLMYQYNGISVALSSPERFPEQGLMLRFSGDGIAFYEKTMREKYPEWDWIKFLKQFFSLGVFGLTCRCTRIDLAYDDISYTRKHTIDLETVATSLRSGAFVSAFKTTDSKTPFRLIPAYEEIKRNTKGEVLGETYYVGNRKSKVFLRFYDKLLECKAKHEPYDEKIKHWIRMEFEFKDVRAMTICDSLIMLSRDEFGKYMSKVTNHYIRFVIPHGVREQYCRCESAEWWINVVNTVEKAKLTENKAYKNKFYSTMRWLKKQVFPTLFAVLHCVKVDELLTDIRDTGADKVCMSGSSNYSMILKDYYNRRQSEAFKGIEIHKASCDDFAALLAEFDKEAYSVQMHYKVLKLCEALNLDDAKRKLMEAHYDELICQYRSLHKPHTPIVEGMYNKDIMNFQNEKQINSFYPFSMY